MPALHMGNHVGQGFVRRHLVQIAALTVALAAVAVLAVVAFRPSGGRDAGAVHAPVTSRPTATADPRVDEVKAVARRYLEAFWESAKTGDTSAVDALTEKDSQAYSNAAVAARISKSANHNFIAETDGVRRGSLGDRAVVRRTQLLLRAYRLVGHDADWPSLRPREPDHETTAYSHDISDGARWGEVGHLPIKLSGWPRGLLVVLSLWCLVALSSRIESVRAAASARSSQPTATFEATRRRQHSV